jgi:hypothetical protein
MYSFRRLAILLALFLPAAHVVLSQDASPSSSSAPQDQAQPGQNGETQGQLSVQARIRARRAQRRAQAIHETYSNLYEAYAGGGYLRFKPGPNLQKATMYSWDAAVTRYYGEKLGVTIDGRGYYGTAFVGLNEASITRPAISQYDAMGGPTYRFILHPRYSIAARAMGGVAVGNFSGDTSGFTPASLGLYSDGATYAINGGIVGEANLSPNLSLRLAGDYLGTGFGSQMQNGFGFTYGFVYRFGKQ